MAEYSYVPLQVVDVDKNVIFTNGARCCKKGYVQHREDSGLFSFAVQDSARLFTRLAFRQILLLVRQMMVECLNLSVLHLLSMEKHSEAL